MASLQPSPSSFDPTNSLLIGVVVAGGDAVSWQIGGLYTSKGASGPGLAGSVFRLDLRAAYLEFPVSARFNLFADRRTHPFVTVGGAPAIKITGQVLRAYDLSAVAEAGVETARWTLGARYSRGFVDSHVSVDGRFLHNEAWAIVWAIKLK